MCFRSSRGIPVNPAKSSKKRHFECILVDPGTYKFIERHELISLTAASRPASQLANSRNFLSCNISNTSINDLFLESSLTHWTCTEL